MLKLPPGLPPGHPIHCSVILQFHGWPIPTVQSAWLAPELRGRRVQLGCLFARALDLGDGPLRTGVTQLLAGDLDSAHDVVEVLSAGRQAHQSARGHLARTEEGQRRHIHDSALLAVGLEVEGVALHPQGAADGEAHHVALHSRAEAVLAVAEDRGVGLDLDDLTDQVRIVVRVVLDFAADRASVLDVDAHARQAGLRDHTEALVILHADERLEPGELGADALDELLLVHVGIHPDPDPGAVEAQGVAGVGLVDQPVTRTQLALDALAVDGADGDAHLHRVEALAVLGLDPPHQATGVDVVRLRLLEEEHLHLGVRVVHHTPEAVPDGQHHTEDGRVFHPGRAVTGRDEEEHEEDDHGRGGGRDQDGDLLPLSDVEVGDHEQTREDGEAHERDADDGQLAGPVSRLLPLDPALVEGQEEEERCGEAEGEQPHEAVQVAVGDSVDHLRDQPVRDRELGGALPRPDVVVGVVGVGAELHHGPGVEGGRVTLGHLVSDRTRRARAAA